VTERYVALLLSPSNPSPRPLEAAKLLLRLSRKAARGEYVSAEGKSPYQLLGDLLDVVEAHAEQVGLGIEELPTTEADDEVSTDADPPPQQNGNSLIRFAGPPIAVGADGKPAPVYDEDEDPDSSRKLDIEKIVRKDGLAVYKDQAGRLWTGLATYWIGRGEFDRARETFEIGMATVLTIRDFTQIFDAFAEFSESVISGIMEELANPDEEDDDFDVKETEEELDTKMKEFEELMDRRPFLVNDVLLRRNPNDVQEWEKRVELWGEDDEKVRTDSLFLGTYRPTGPAGGRDVHPCTLDRCSAQGNSELLPLAYRLCQVLRTRRNHRRSRSRPGQRPQGA
jgi:pre-mRNA-splicing factor SYF1